MGSFLWADQKGFLLSGVKSVLDCHTNIVSSIFFPPSFILFIYVNLIALFNMVLVYLSAVYCLSQASSAFEHYICTNIVFMGLSFFEFHNTLKGHWDILWI